jgi:hypothetical protein
MELVSILLLLIMNSSRKIQSEQMISVDGLIRLSTVKFFKRFKNYYI